jgi:hypothetical protein
MLSSSVDWHPLGHRVRKPAAAAGGQEKETVAETGGTMNVVDVSRVDPDLDAVAVFRARRTTPRILLLAGNDY